MNTINQSQSPNWISKENWDEIKSFALSIPGAIAITSEGPQESEHFSIVLTKEIDSVIYEILDAYSGCFSLNVIPVDSPAYKEAPYVYILR